MHDQSLEALLLCITQQAGIEMRKTCSRMNADPTQGHSIMKAGILQALPSIKMIYGQKFPYCFFDIQLFFQMPSSYDKSQGSEETWNDYLIQECPDILRVSYQ